MKVDEIASRINHTAREYQREKGKTPLLCVYVEMDFYQAMLGEVSVGSARMDAHAVVTMDKICGVDVFPVLSKRGGKRPVSFHVAVIGESSQ